MVFISVALTWLYVSDGTHFTGQTLFVCFQPHLHPSCTADGLQRKWKVHDDGPLFINPPTNDYFNYFTTKQKSVSSKQ
jgi:hypothetical protein